MADILRTGTKEIIGKLKYEAYAPGDGYIYRFVHSLCSEIVGVEEEIIDPKHTIFIAELTSKVKAFTLTFKALKDESAQSLIRDLGECSPERANVVYHFLKERYEKIATNTTPVIVSNKPTNI